MVNAHTFLRFYGRGGGGMKDVIIPEEVMMIKTEG